MGKMQTQSASTVRVLPIDGPHFTTGRIRQTVAYIYNARCFCGSKCHHNSIENDYCGSKPGLSPPLLILALTLSLTLRMLLNLTLTLLTLLTIRSHRFPVPVRLAIKSNLTSWCDQILSKHALNSANCSIYVQIRAEKVFTWIVVEIIV